MATYELYLWETEVDLSASQWQQKFSELDDDDLSIKEIIEYQIYYRHNEDLHPAPKLLKFFQTLYDIVNQEKYLPYFDGLVEAVKNDLDSFKNHQRLVFRTEADYLSHRRDSES